ncbi:non-ribosomal peptide synthetase component F [Catenulispora sp. GP43]|uniref:amino acid adenylation domain-containing protein n=1 Tax=Catenulispora sp. GP43 TaxID=3156263 RepID=UPI003515672B
MTEVMTAFADAVRRSPDRPAIVHNGRTLTYADLAALVDAKARDLGSDPGVVGVPATHAPDTVIGLLGVFAAGGAYMPIDPAFPAERVEAMYAAASGHPVSGPAYVLFTSGSTGAPKPVLTPGGAAGITVAALAALFELTPADRVLQFASLNWDTCFEEILPALTTGAALVFDDEAHTGSFPRFLRMVAERRISVLDLPTAFWHELVRHLAEDEAVLPDCLRLVIIGGEAASPARLADWHRLDTSGIRLLNTYGCTETTMITHAADLDDPGAERIPIGRPLPHVRELIEDAGELLIGGPALAAGYLGGPEATAERFLERADGRWFRTGDRVSRGRDGLLFHEGRIDHQVKIRGVRVDPGEVEAHLTRHPAVAAAAVTGVTLAGRTALVGYVAAPESGPEGDTDHADLLGWLRQRVPAHLVPSRITFVPELVHTASGKVDRAGTHRRYAAKENPR